MPINRLLLTKADVAQLAWRYQSLIPYEQGLFMLAFGAPGKGRKLIGSVYFVGGERHTASPSHSLCFDTSALRRFGLGLIRRSKCDPRLCSNCPPVT